MVRILAEKGLTMKVRGLPSTHYLRRGQAGKLTDDRTIFSSEQLNSFAALPGSRNLRRLRLADGQAARHSERSKCRWKSVFFLRDLCRAKRRKSAGGGRDGLQLLGEPDQDFVAA